MMYTVSYATMDDLDAFICLQDRVADRMDSCTHFAKDDGEYFCKAVTGKGQVFFVRNKDLPIACCMLSFPDADDAANLGFDMNFSHEQRQHVAHLELICIHPDYQGKRLASRLIAHAIPCAVSHGKELLLATIHPCNTASLRTFFTAQFIVCGFAYKYGDLPRCIMYYQPDFVYDTHLRYVLCDDFQAHQTLLSQGMCGVCITDDHGSHSLGYVERCSEERM